MLFHSRAFIRTIRTFGFTQLSERVISYADGIPLALKVVGSLLRGKRQENWESELNKLRECPNEIIQNVLRVSYNSLDLKQKRILLDIACFFKGTYRDYVERILDACGVLAKSGIDDLIDKSLITVKDNNRLWMHDFGARNGLAHCTILQRAWTA